MYISIGGQSMIIILFMNSDQLPQVNHTKHKHQQHHKILWSPDRG